MIPRPTHQQALRTLLRQFPVVALIGARQVGKTTLAREIASARRSATAFDLERPADLARLASPELALAPLRGLVILDEIQRRPDLFPTLRVMADRPRRPAAFLVLGSASPPLLHQASESLAGRIAYYELPPLSLWETGPATFGRRWLRGGFPRAFLAATDAQSLAWREEFIRTFLERDLPQLGVTIPALTLRRFWAMLAHYHGRIWNGAELGRAFGVAHTTVRRYLDLLTGGFVVRQLSPWHANLGKRQVKTPKVYIADSGLLHALLGLETQDALESHPAVGASWEGFALEMVTGLLRARPEDCYFWATHMGAELDLLVRRGTVTLGFEFKRTDTPALTRSMRVALEDLRLDHLYVVHPGADTFPLAPQVTAVALPQAPSVLRPLR
ncbi:MAG TPA: ATP-binding protein [Candidatus Methylomirabilis sp.]|nr:ATP-binding protein [Candidatus Methylomirabilis sp.]